MFLTASSTLKKIISNGEEFSLGSESLNFTHYHLVFEGQLVKKISYIRALDQPLIHRISNISTQLGSKTGENLSVLLVGVRVKELNLFQNEADAIDAILKYLISNGIINEQNTLQFSKKKQLYNRLFSRKFTR